MSLRRLSASAALYDHLIDTGDDRGGHSHQLQAYGHGTNLHALWDSAMVKQWPGRMVALEEAMEKLTVTARSVDPREWAEA
jgi:hypothetical protein